MIKRTHTIIIILGLILGIVGSVLSGPPVDMWQQGELWMAAEYGTSYRMLPGEDRFGVQEDALPSRSNRTFLKAGYEVYSWLDMFAMLGLADLSINSSDPTFNDYRSDMTLAWGGGAKFGYYYPDWNLGASLTSTVIGFSSEADVTNHYRRVVSRYQWWEIQNELAFTYPLNTITPFLGVEKTILMGIHEVEDYFLGNLQPRPEGTDTYSDYQQQFRPLAGLSLHLPGGYTVFVKASGIATDEFFLGVGLCQGSK